MSREGALSPPSVARHLAILGAAAFTLLAASLALPSRYLPALGVVTGCAATLTVADFAWRRARRAEWFADKRTGRGRIVEHTDAGRLVFELPADGIEPWAFDAWVLAIATFGVLLLGSSARPVVYVFLSFLFVAVGRRLLAVRNDRIRLELGGDGFLIDAMSANRPIRRVGTGPILPELDADSLTLWSSAGRLGVLRNELTRRERVWLADRLASLAERFSSTAGEPNHQVDQEHARDDGQGEQQKHPE